MKQPTPWWMWLLPLPIVWWFALITVGVWRPGMDLMRLMEELSTALEQPWNIRWSEYFRQVPAAVFHSFMQWLSVWYGPA